LRRSADRPPPASAPLALLRTLSAELLSHDSAMLNLRPLVLVLKKLSLHLN
jgi:hypothetical protein